MLKRSLSQRKTMMCRFSPWTWNPSGMSDTGVTAPPGLSVCRHLRGASWAPASVLISQTAIRPGERSRSANFLTPPRRFVCTQESPSLQLLLFLLSHLPPSSSPPVLHPLRSSVKFLTFATKTRDWEVAQVAHVRWRTDARDLWGLRACRTSYFPHQSPRRCAKVGSICWVSVRPPLQPTQGPLAMPQVHLEYKPNGTHLVLDRWTPVN